MTAVAMAALPAGIAHANDGDPSSALAAPPAAHDAQAGKGGNDIVFFGSGWGHGVGMSQWGSYGLAKQGWSYTDILRRYYSDTTVAQAPAGSPTSVRVGLTWARSSLQLTARSGPVTLRFGKPTARDKFSIPKDATWRVALDPNGHFLITNARGRTYPPIGGPNWRMFASYTQNNSQLKITEAGHTYGRGVIEFDSYRLGSWAIRAIAILDPDQYLYGLGEVPNYWPLDALKVQAVAGRTYAFYAMENHPRRYTDCNCDLYPDYRSQSYLGWDKESDQLGDQWKMAVNQTSGQVVLYHGALILANYYSTSGGYTESNENVWFNDPVPYLRSVCDPGDYSAPVGLRTWRTDPMSRSSVGSDFGVGTVTSFTNVRRSTNSGRIISITVNGSGGLRGSSRTVTGPQFSSALGLMDDKVWIDQNRNIEGAIRNEYDSLNCAPGLAASSHFAVRAGSVQRFANGAIYTNPKVSTPAWLHGNIYAKYRAYGGANTVLGLPRTGLIPLTDPAGCATIQCARAEFDGGRIYDKGTAPAHEVHGRVMAYWLAHGGAAGPLGFPTSDVFRVTGGMRSRFEHGTVTCPASGTCHRVMAS